jgi:TetR/AcrR family transcriptional regulator, hemagglutinin/protease regulatory protein
MAKVRRVKRAPSTRMRAARLQPAARQAHLVQVAVRVFAQRGLGAARPVDVAAAAGVAESTVFAYFPSREALMSAVLGEVDRFCSGVNERVLHRIERPAPELVVELARAFAEVVDTHPDHARVWLDWSTAIRDDVWPRYVDFQERIIAEVAKMIRRGQRQGTFDRDMFSEDEARMLYGSAQMAAQMKFTGRPAREVRRFLTSMAAATLRRMAPSGATAASRVNRAVFKSPTAAD